MGVCSEGRRSVAASVSATPLGDVLISVYVAPLAYCALRLALHRARHSAGEGRAGANTVPLHSYPVVDGTTIIHTTLHVRQDRLDSPQQRWHPRSNRPRPRSGSRAPNRHPASCGPCSPCWSESRPLPCATTCLLLPPSPCFAHYALGIRV